jgi:hypothetical protein
VAVIVDADSFPNEEAALLLKAAASLEGNSAAAVDDPVPGKTFLFGGRVEDPDDLAGGSIVPGEGGDLGIGRHFSAGDRLDDALDPILEFQARTSRKILILTLTHVNLKSPRRTQENVVSGLKTKNPTIFQRRLFPFEKERQSYGIKATEASSIRCTSISRISGSKRETR